MDERVLGDVPSEGSERGRRFGVFVRQYSDLRVKGVSKNLLLFVTVVSSVVAFSIFYPVLQYATKVNRLNDLVHPGNNNLTVLSDEQHKNSSSNCSTLVFSFGHDCSEQFGSPREQVKTIQATEPGSTTTELRRFDESSQNYIEGKLLETITNSDKEKDLPIQRNGRSKWPTISTPYPYYIPPTQTSPMTPQDKDLTLQETNVFAIPSDLRNFRQPERSSTRVNFTPPPYVFTPYPNFTGNYAQLTPYKTPQNNSNLNQVMKYLSTISASERNYDGEHQPAVSRVKNTMMKVSGTYVIPLDRRRPGEIILTSSSENIEKTQPFFNGHAYISDPFTKYRPTDPSDVNRLIPVKSSLDTGPRFRRPVSFVPTSSTPVEIIKSVSSEGKDYQYQSAGSHTVAIFHPPTVASVKAPGVTPPVIPRKKDKPLSVTLDIYPVTVDSEADPGGYASTPAGRERGRHNPKWRPKATERPKWRPPAYMNPADQATDNHMIVHLNLFPHKRKPYTYIRRSRTETSNESETEGLQQDQMVARSGSSETHEARFDSTEATVSRPEPLIASHALTTSLNDQPDTLSAVESSGKQEEETTTITDISPNVVKN